ncbi:MAG: rhomboid family intramembrane serine protease [Anaerolineae bacterium]
MIGNMLYLWVFGDNVEDALGHGLYLGFYLLGGIVAGVVSAFMTGISHVPNLGASGAIAAVLGAYLIMFPGERIRVIGIGGGVGIGYVPAVAMIAFWALLQFISGLGVIGSTAGGVGYWAHIGGFVFGLLVGFLYRGTARRQARVA